MRRAMPMIMTGAVVVLVFVLATRGAANTSQTEISPETAFQKLRAEVAIVVDVRTPQEYAQGHVQGAVNFPLSQISDRSQELAELAGTREIVLYCRSGRRAQLAEEILLERGFSQILHLRGQFAGWRSAGLPVEGG